MPASLDKPLKTWVTPINESVHHALAEQTAFTSLCASCGAKYTSPDMQLLRPDVC